MSNRYYWIKLKTDFFADDSPMDILLSMPNGSEYVCLYIKLCLKTANNEGRMCAQYGEMLIPYNIEKIQQDMKYFSIDTIRVAFELYKKMGLIYEESDGVLKISDHDEMVGSETGWAKYKRSERKQIGQSLDNVQQSIEIRDKRIEKRDKKKDKEIEKFYPSDEYLDQAFSDFVAMRKKIKAPMTDKAIELAKKKLEDLSGGDNDKAVEIINQSILNGWKSFYQLKEHKSNDAIDWEKV